MYATDGKKERMYIIIEQQYFWIKKTARPKANFKFKPDVFVYIKNIDWGTAKMRVGYFVNRCFACLNACFCHSDL